MPPSWLSMSTRGRRTWGPAASRRRGRRRGAARATTARSAPYAGPITPAATPVTTPGALEERHPALIRRYVRGTRRADAGDDLVGDGAEALGPLGGGDLVVALRGRSARRRRRPRPATSPRSTMQLVHRDDADDRAAAAPDQHLATRQPEVAGHAVGVARGHGRDAARRARPRSAGRTRAACAGGQRLHERDPAVQRHRGTQRQRRRSPPSVGGGMP